jgi:hypothetical protein
MEILINYFQYTAYYLVAANEMQLEMETYGIMDK